MRYTRRSSGPYLLLILPDRSRSLIPAEWTDWGHRPDSRQDTRQ
ncbi:MAG: hypothetical protein IPK02_22305 [Candidatus Accumulibacter sp.]|uniref:Uncharacterized protein n=1 Tax=Candidatus Accumulibacter affinis TaxID=2954384 RepID=A0A935TEZ1_9PROT|nr:hypothetical protein [Candidatus Accumulibacter affinis]